MNRKQGETLAEYVKRVREAKGFSLSAVEQKSARYGEKIAGSYVSRIENNLAEAEGVTPKKLLALARGLEVPFFMILAVAIGEPLDSHDEFNPEKESLWEMYSDVPTQCQKDVRDLLAVLQKNHSLRGRRSRIVDHREDVRKRRDVAASSVTTEGETSTRSPQTTAPLVKGTSVIRPKASKEPDRVEGKERKVGNGK